MLPALVLTITTDFPISSMAMLLGLEGIIWIRLTRESGHPSRGALYLISTHRLRTVAFVRQVGVRR